jgi:hypothetical protein
MNNTDIKPIFKIAAKRDGDPSDLVRSLEGAPPYDTDKVGVIINMAAYTRLALGTLSKGLDEINAVNSDAISPDGKLGGRGYVMAVREIKQKLIEMITGLSDIRDTFTDELKNPGWGLSKEQIEAAIKIELGAAQQADTAVETVQSGSAEIVQQTEPVSDDQTTEAPTDGTTAPEGAPDEDESFPDMGGLDETAPPPEEAPPEEETPEDEVTTPPQVKLASDPYFVGFSKKKDPITNTLSRVVLASLINLETKANISGT